MATELSGELAVVTGALGQLGPVWVRTLAAAGADVVGVDVSDAGAEELRAGGGGRVALARADVTDRAALDRGAAELPGAPRVLVASAGIDPAPPAEPVTPSR